MLYQPHWHNGNENGGADGLWQHNNIVQGAGEAPDDLLELLSVSDDDKAMAAMQGKSRERAAEVLLSRSSPTLTVKVSYATTKGKEPTTCTTGPGPGQHPASSG